MVVVGGLTRLTHSGLSMVEWSVTGSFPPTNQNDWQALFDKYKNSPEYKLINFDFTIDDFKEIFWFEYIHRLIGRILGIVFVLPFAYFLMKKKIPDGFAKKLVFLLLIGGLQGLIGWYMVKSGLVKNPQVSHYRLAFHLITAFITFGFTFWFALDLIYPNKQSKINKNLLKLIMVFMGFLVLQIVYGAFVAGLKAGYIYTTYPKMGNEWIPSLITEQKPIWLNFFEMHAGVQFLHRIIAIILLIISVIIYYKSNKYNISKKQKRNISLIPSLLFLQFILGIFTLIFSVPLFLAITHQTLAFVIFSVVLFNLHSLKNY